MTPKRIKRLLREFAAKAHEEELRRGRGTSSSSTPGGRTIRPWLTPSPPASSIGRRYLEDLLEHLALALERKSPESPSHGSERHGIGEDCCPRRMCPRPRGQGPAMGPCQRRHPRRPTDEHVPAFPATGAVCVGVRAIGRSGDGLSSATNQATLTCLVGHRSAGPDVGPERSVLSLTEGPNSRSS